MHPTNSAGGALARTRRTIASLRERLHASVHALLVLRVVGAAVVVAVLAWVGGRTSAIPGALAQGRTPDPTGLVATTDAAPTGAAAAPNATSGNAATAPNAAACVCEAPKVAGTSRARASPSDPVDVNAADEGDLRRLPGVGPKRAEAIVALRRKLGRFRKVEDLLRVKGVGRATLRRWRPLVRLEGPAPNGTEDAGAPSG